MHVSTRDTGPRYSPRHRIRKEMAHGGGTGGRRGIYGNSLISLDVCWGGRRKVNNNHEALAHLGFRRQPEAAGSARGNDGTKGPESGDRSKSSSARLSVVTSRGRSYVTNASTERACTLPRLCTCDASASADVGGRGRGRGRGRGGDMPGTAATIAGYASANVPHSPVRRFPGIRRVLRGFTARA